MNNTSRKLAFLLRHSQDPLYISLDGGWAQVSDIVKALNISRTQLDEIVATDNKQRYMYDTHKQRIRACQGHSIPGVKVEMTQPAPPEYLYHGTATRFLDVIMKEGLKPMSRQWVHLSGDAETALNVGTRHGNPIILRVAAQKFVADGNQLFLSLNGVWQAKFVPPEYLEIN